MDVKQRLTSLAEAVLQHGRRGAHRGDHARMTKPLHEQRLLVSLQAPSLAARELDQGNCHDAKVTASSTPTVLQNHLQPHVSEHKLAAMRLHAFKMDVAWARHGIGLQTTCSHDKDGSWVIATSWHSPIPCQHRQFAASCKERATTPVNLHTVG